MLKPAGWNEFGGSPDTYVIKWVDIVNQQDEIVILNSTPVKSTTTSVTALGEVKEVSGHNTTIGVSTSNAMVSFDIVVMLI